MFDRDLLRKRKKEIKEFIFDDKSSEEVMRDMLDKCEDRIPPKDFSKLG
jgi:hypothetical protein